MPQVRTVLGLVRVLGGGGRLMCMKLHWGPCNCNEREDTGRERGHWETVNPRSVTPSHRVDRDAQDDRDVRHYERNPNAALDGGVPWVQQGIFFRSSLQNGHHRRQAAINKGRRLRIWVRE